MMRTLRVLFVLPFLMLFAAGCGAIPNNITINVVDPTLDVGKVVQATFQAMTAQPGVLPTATAVQPTPTSTSGSISGTLNYPSEGIPSLYVAAYQVGTQNYQYVITNAGQANYEIDDLSPGTYHVVAYTVGGGGFPTGLAGGYTQAVPCGLAANCTDHTLIDVPLAAGQAATSISPTDWYAPDGTFPVFPGQAAAATSVPGAATLPPAIADGSIAGNLMYPASGLPSLRIVAFLVGSSTYYYTDTALGQSSYQLDHVPPGTYHVVAYVLPGGKFTGGLPGGYSQMVPCGLQYGCNDHTLIDVVVTSAHVTTGIDPNDYYADAGAFPANPVP
jgi:hypothetical protein